jgi:N-methylhydantoinase A/oxoprolinase/acetone carboxylase beta subunit
VLRIGVDVGGTNTDAVIMDGRNLLAWAKVRTSEDVTGGIVASIHEALARASVPLDQAGAVMIGTTHFTNAIVQRRDLTPTAVVRLGLPATTSIPPLADWPDDLRLAVRGRGYIAHGGYEFDGRELSSVDAGELRSIGRDIAQSGIRSVALAGVFSPIRSEQEECARRILGEELPDARFSVSHEIGRLGLLERENACALNACMADLAERTVAAIEAAMRELGVPTPLFLSQNDGTLWRRRSRDATRC